MFIGAVSGPGENITACTVNGAGCTKIGEAMRYSVHEFWRVGASPGEGMVSVTGSLEALNDQEPSR